MHRGPGKILADRFQQRLVPQSGYGMLWRLIARWLRLGVLCLELRGNETDDQQAEQPSDPL
jgi:hypothetical protein